MNGLVRLGIGAVLGLVAAVAILLVFINEIKFSQGAFFGTLLIVGLVVTYVSAFGTNTVINAISCPSVNVGKTATSSLIPAGTAAGIVLLFIMLESWTGIFGFIFKTIVFRFRFQSAYSNASVFGLLFAVFWATLYGELIAGSASEFC